MTYNKTFHDIIGLESEGIDLWFYRNKEVKQIYEREIRKKQIYEREIRTVNQENHWMTKLINFLNI